MKRPPPYFDSETTSPETPLEPEVVLPDMLPPMYKTLCEENEISESPAKSCPIFKDNRDPDGYLRCLAGLISH